MLTKQEEQDYSLALTVAELSRHKGWVEWLKPQLEVKLNQAFPDPSKFSKEEEFVYAAKVASVFKKVVAEILSMVDDQVKKIEYYDKKKEGRTVNKFAIGEEV